MMSNPKGNVTSTSITSMAQAETQNQNALSRQLLSSTPAQKSGTETSPSIRPVAGPSI